VAPPSYRVAVIDGDGIGPEIVAAAMAVLDAAGDGRFVLERRAVSGGAQTYLEEGEALTREGLETIERADATLKGPVGLPDVRLPSGTEAGLLGGLLRNGFDLFANVRPVLLLPGVPTRLRAEPGSIDYVIVRENTEGLYASRDKGVGNHWAMTDTLIVTRPGCERVARYAFELARTRTGAPADGGRRVTCVDKANVLRSMYFFREVFLEVSAEYPDIEIEMLYVDAAAQALVMNPEHFDVIVTENMFGDILSDLGGATVGGIALCPSGNIGETSAYFEPIHGSAPTIAGMGIANPIGQILSGALMLDYLGEDVAARAIRQSVSAALGDGAIELLANGAAKGGPDAVAGAIIERLAVDESSG
jgi:3-isopropylmalate dehydrogenase